jgi:hypothetical protein
LDLLSKNTAQAECVKEVLDETTKLAAFLKRDRIDSIRQEAIQRGDLDDMTVPKKMIENRMITVHLHLESMRKQAPFMDSLCSNNKFTKFYNSRTAKDKQEIDTIFRRTSLMTWQNVDMMLSLTQHFHDAHKFFSRADTPLSAYYLTVQGLKNGIHSVLHSDDGLFDHVMGFGAAKELDGILHGRFNMDGEKPDGRRVSLLDYYHLWVHLVDPFFYKWRNIVKFAVAIRVLTREMISFLFLWTMMVRRLPAKSC